MRRQNNLILLEMVMNDSFPSWNLTLMEFWYSSSGSVSAFNHRKRFFQSKFLIDRNIDAVIMCDLTQIEVPLTDRQRIQSFKRRCMSSKLAFLNVGLKHESTRSDTTCAEGAVPAISSNDLVTHIESSFHCICKTLNKVTHWQHNPRSVCCIVSNLY